jgi:mRNA-degrading endonuclease RelE of RelBE toxin-antitoxin system
MRILYRPSFTKHLKKYHLSGDDLKILKALKDLEEIPSLSEAKRLSKMEGTDNQFRYKIGNYRVLLTWDKKVQALIVETVALRKDIYKKK